MTGDQLKLINVRLSFPDLFEPKSVNNSEPKYGAAFLLDKDHDSEQIKAIKVLMWKLAKEKFGTKAKTLLEKGAIKICLHEGSSKDYDGYNEQNMYLSTSSKRRPTVVDRARAPLTKEDSRPYAGCYVNVVVRLWAQDNQFGKRINAELQGVQFSEDGEPFGAAPFDANEAFDELEKPQSRAEGGSDEPAGDGDGEDGEDECPI